MHSNYEDILSRIKEEPLWYDTNGVPRYAKFEPNLCPDIYSNTVILMEIACQYCGQRFDVEMHAGIFGTQLRPKGWHYGDPPRHDCPGGGDTMNCDDIAVLECWHREGMGDWVRRRELEGHVDA